MEPNGVVRTRVHRASWGEDGDAGWFDGSGRVGVSSEGQAHELIDSEGENADIRWQKTLSWPRTRTWRPP